MKPGQRFGAFTLLSRIGEGASGVVWEASQVSPQRRVALKVLRSGDRVTRARFEREVEVLGWLAHPGIAQLYEAGFAAMEGGDELPFLAMEHIEGVSIDRFASDLADVRGCTELLARLCDAVQHAHQRGVLHRDLKPSNVLVTEAGEPKVVDFGVAGVLTAEVGETLRTQTTTILGTLPYIAPEALTGESPVDARADVFGLGVLAYEVISGRLPIHYSDLTLPQALRRAAEAQAEPLTDREGGSVGDLAAVIAKSIEREPERRYATAAEFGADLRRYLRHEPVLARPQTVVYQLEKYARRHPAIAFLGSVAALLLVVGAGLSTVLLWQARGARNQAEETRELTRVSEENVRAARIATEERAERARQAERDRTAAIDRARAALRKATDEGRATQSVAAFLDDLLKASLPSEARGQRILASQILDRGLERLESETDPFVRQSVGDALERARLRLGD